MVQILQEIIHCVIIETACVTIILYIQNIFLYIEK